MLKKELLPNWFEYPAQFTRIKSLNLVKLDPWYIMEDEDVAFRFNGLKERFPDIELIPFARREDNDDVACWEKSGGNIKIFVVHDYSKLGWKNSKTYQTFWDWFKKAIEDMIEHEE